MDICVFDFTKKNFDNIPLNNEILSHCKTDKSIICAKALLSMGVVNLHYNEKGKPLSDNCFVSISHSKNMCCVCKSKNPIGIDIEFLESKRDFKSLAKKYFKGSELSYFNKNPTAKIFYEIWTKKEAYSKISGLGLKEIIKGFDVFTLKNYKFKTEYSSEFVFSVCEKTI